MDYESDNRPKSKQELLRSLIEDNLQRVVDGIWRNKEEADRFKGDFIRGLRAALSAQDSEVINTKALNDLIKTANNAVWSDQESINALYEQAFRMLYPKPMVANAIENPEGEKKLISVKTLVGTTAEIEEGIYEQIQADLKTMELSEVIEKYEGTKLVVKGLVSAIQKREKEIKKRLSNG